MSDKNRTMTLGLLGLGLMHLVWFMLTNSSRGLDPAGVLFADGTPVGGDFVNLWSAGRLVLEGRVAEIYDPAALMAYQQGMVKAPIGYRLWAYPPHSLLLASPFGLLGFYPALTAWSALGLAMLAVGARRFGFGTAETMVLLLSPASVLCLYAGQTGNLATGLLLLGLSARQGRDLPASLGAAILTIKPQIGFLLPLFWLMQRKWHAIAWTSALTILAALVALFLFGAGAWRDYLGVTLPALGQFERLGTGPFMRMIPSVFMAWRILSGDADTALLMHAACAVVVIVILLVRFRQIDDGLRRAGLVLVATSLITPYLHNYDLTLLLAGALLVSRRWPAVDLRSLGVNVLVALAWALPQLVVALNAAGLPLSPLLILPLLLLV